MDGEEGRFGTTDDAAVGREGEGVGGLLSNIRHFPLPVQSPGDPDSQPAADRKTRPAIIKCLTLRM